MNRTVEDRYNGALGNAIQREVHVYSSRPPRGKRMDLRCPDCNSVDLKRVSLAYQESVRHVDTRTRLRAFLFGSDGPNLIVGKAVTQGVHWTQLSKVLSPPRKWSYVRLILGILVVTVAALFAYVIFVASSPPPVTTLPLKMYVFLA